MLVEHPGIGVQAAVHGGFPVALVGQHVVPGEHLLISTQQEHDSIQYRLVVIFSVWIIFNESAYLGDKSGAAFYKSQSL